MPLILRREPDLTDDFWLVYINDQERAVGRVYRKTAPNGSDDEWFWGLAFPYTLNEPQPFYGTVATREEAMARFKECWERSERR